MNAAIAEATFKNLPRVNGYAERFSVRRGEATAIRVALTGRAEGISASHVVALEIIDAVSGDSVRRIDYAAAVELFVEVPLSFCGDGAGYRCRLGVETVGLAPGVYALVVHIDDGGRSEGIYLLVKPQNLNDYEALAFVLPTFTWHAYNRVGGGSLYVKPAEGYHRVSLQRPFETVSEDGLHAMQSCIPFLQLAREQGHCFTVIDSVDLHDGVLDGSPVHVLTLMGHDEYWSVAMRESVNRFLSRGGSLLALGGNICWWRVEFDGRDVSVRKGPDFYDYWFKFAPKDPEETTFASSYRFAGYPVSMHYKKKSDTGRLLNHLSEAEVKCMDGVTVVTPNHPLFAGINLGAAGEFGTDVPIIYGEVDGIPLTAAGEADIKAAPYLPKDISTLATAYAANSAGYPKGLCHVGCFIEARVRGGTVLHCGTFGIARGMMRNDAQIQRLVANALAYAKAAT